MRRTRPISVDLAKICFVDTVGLHHEAHQRIGQLTDSAQSDLVNSRLSRVLRAYRYYLSHKKWTEEQTRQWAVKKILNEYGRKGVPTYAEWCRQHDTPPTVTSGPVQDPTVTPTC